MYLKYFVCCFSYSLKFFHFFFQPPANGTIKTAPQTDDQLISDDKSHMYWAKGTGFGTGSTQQSWDVEQALLRQKSEEEHVTVLLQVRIVVVTLSLSPSLYLSIWNKLKQKNN